MKFFNKKSTVITLTVIFCLLISDQYALAIPNADGHSESIDVEQTPLTDYIKMQGFSLEEGVNGNTNMPAGVGVPATQPSFFNSIYDGSSIWLPSSSADKIVKVSPDTGLMHGFGFAEGINGNSNMGNASTKSGRFAGGVVVGDAIWLVPYSIDRLVKLDILTGTMTGFSFTDGVNGNTNVGTLGAVAGKFGGGVYDGINVWMIPTASSKLVRVNPQTGTMVGFDMTEGINGNTNMPGGSNFFNGGFFDGTYIWMIPFNSPKVVRLDPDTGTMLGFDMTEGVNGNSNMGNLGNAPLLAAYKFYGGAYDGENIWMAPGNGDRVVRLNTMTGTMTGFEMTDGVNGNSNMGDSATVGYRYSQGNYDGKNIWMFPSYANRLVKINPQTGTMTGYELEEGAFAATGNTNMGDVPTTAYTKFYGGCFDGKNLWATPWRSNRLVKISSTIGLKLNGTPENETQTYGAVKITAEVNLYNSGVAVDEVKYIQNSDPADLSKDAFLSLYSTIDDSEKGDFTNTEEIEGSLARYTFYTNKNAVYHVYLKSHDPITGQIIELTESYTVSNILAAVPTYSYTAEYYRGSISETNRIETTTGSVTFAEGHQLTLEDIESDLGTGWLNAKKPASGYNNGATEGGFPVISQIIENNVVKVLYTVISGGGTTYYTINTKYLDTSGNPIDKEKTASIARGQSYTVTAPAIEGYKYVETIKDNGAAMAERTVSINPVITNHNIIFRYDLDRPILDKTSHNWYIRGYGDNTIKPDENLTRAEMAMIFYRLVTNYDKDTKEPRKVLNDIDINAWYAKAVTYLYDYDIVSGYSDKTYRPNAFITRAEIAKMSSMFNHLEIPIENTFSDVPENHWAYSYVASASEKGWIQGYADGTFRPDEYASRAEMAILINRVLNRCVKPESLLAEVHTWSDLLTTHWAYADIMEAAHSHEYERTSDNDYEAWTRITETGFNAASGE